MEWSRDSLLVSDERSRLDVELIHAFLARSYWAERIPRALVERSLAGSLCFGAYDDGRQVAFARVVTDRATFAYLADVFVVEDERGKGVAAFLIECVHAHPELQGLRRWMLVTRDAHGLYEKLGWRVVAEPGRVMEIVRRDAYR